MIDEDTIMVWGHSRCVIFSFLMCRIVILRLESLTSYRYVHPLKARRYNFLHNLEFTCQNIRTFSGFIGTVLLWSYRLS